MNTLKRGYFDTPIGQIHYRSGCSTGIVATPLLLLHQSPLSSCQFDAVLPALADAGFHAVALDLPGFGMSDPLPEPVTLQGYADIIPAAYQHFGWQQAALLGHHTGAVIAALFAGAVPAQVTRLVLNGFPLLNPAEREYFSSFAATSGMPQEDGHHLLVAWRNRLRSTPGWTDVALMHRYTVEGLQRYATNQKALPLIVRTDLAPLLQQLRVPTLLFTNTGEDLYRATRRAWQLRPEFFYYAELVGGSHDIIDEQPVNWVKVVADFLRDADKRSGSWAQQVVREPLNESVNHQEGDACVAPTRCFPGKWLCRGEACLALFGKNRFVQRFLSRLLKISFSTACFEPRMAQPKSGTFQVHDFASEQKSCLLRYDVEKGQDSPFSTTC